MSVSIHELHLPENPNAQDWVDYCALRVDENHEEIGGPGWDTDPATMLTQTRGMTQEVHSWRWLARIDGEAVGYAELECRFRDDPEGSALHIFVTPSARSQGAARALAVAAFEQIRVGGYARATTWVAAELPTGERIVPPNGVGAAPAEAPGIRFALGLGFELAQIERMSRYDFAGDNPDPAEVAATAALVAGPDYELITWTGVSSPDLAADLAVLRQRMSTDLPAGALTQVESSWDAERLIARDRRNDLTLDSWRAAARHVPSGRIVAISELMRERGNPDALVDQWDTIVVPEHRGHRLGMLVKAANLARVRRVVPANCSIFTWNAEENRHMLDINEALGFRAFRVEAAFEKQLHRERP